MSIGGREDSVFQGGGEIYFETMGVPSGNWAGIGIETDGRIE